MSIAFGISSSYYAGEESNLARTVQGKHFLGDTCWGILYLIIRVIDKENIGRCFKSVIMVIEEQTTELLFVDDVDVMSEGRETE